MDAQATTMGDDFDYPPDDSDRTWHVHDDYTWGWEIRCEVCRGSRPGVSGQSPMMNIRVLSRQNREGTTTASEEREALGDRWDDPKIGRVS